MQSKSSRPPPPELPWVEVAKRELGVAELSGSEANPRIMEYLAATAGDEPAEGDECPWCAAFLSWVLLQCKMRSPRTKRARKFLQYGRESGLIRGAIAVFSRGTDTRYGHVGIVERVTPTHIWLLAGNQGNRVSIRPYPRERLLGCRWPV